LLRMTLYFTFCVQPFFLCLSLGNAVCSLVAVAAGDLGYLLELLDDEAVIVLAVGYAALFAVLDSLFRVAEITSAVLAKRVERAVAEKAVEIIFRYSFVAGKGFAFLVAEIRVVLIFPVGLTVIHSGASSFYIL